ncbi:tetratricopeptide repeat protein [Nonomuraea sp. NPDC049637]|uniref:ATP-binding protein n=1 Tax=Nonomuraea sp. NPDC049637 TaxID=3154356 RepID=UPI00342EF3CF
MALDDVTVELTSGFLLLQAKKGMQAVSPSCNPLAQAIEQVVQAMITGIPTQHGPRPVDAALDRLVIATSEDGSKSFDELGTVCRRLQGHPFSIPLEYAAKTVVQRRALRTIIEMITREWSRATGSPPTEVELRQLLKVLEVVRYDFAEEGGADLARLRMILRNCTDFPMIDRPLETLTQLGHASQQKQTWFPLEDLRRAVQATPAAGNKSYTNHLRPMPDPYIPRTEYVAEFPDGQVIVFSGGAGCGKTTLALHLAHHSIEDFPDAQLMVDMRGYGTGVPMSSKECVDTLLAQLGEEPTDACTDIQKRQLLINLLNDKRCIVVLDNVAESPDIVFQLLRKGSSKIILTSRRALANLSRESGVRSVQVDALQAVEAYRLFAAYVDEERIAKEPESAQRILDVCGNLPLAVEIAGAHVRSLGHQSLARIATGLTDSEARLDFLDLGEPASSIGTIFSWTYDTLSDAQKTTFVMVGNALGPDLPSEAVAALLGTGRAIGRLRELRHLNLVQEDADGVFHMHDLLRDYACSLARQDRQLFEASSRANRELVRCYTEYVKESLPSARVEGKAEMWLDKNVERVLCAIIQGVKRDGLLDCMALADALIEHMWRCGRSSEYVDILRACVSLSREAGDIKSAEYFLRQAAITLRRIGSHEECVEHAEAALDLVAPHTLEAADSHGIIAAAHSYAGNHEAALANYYKALALFGQLDQDEAAGDIHNGLGWSLLQLGRTTEALYHCDEALTIHRAVGNLNSMAADLDSLAFIRREMGDREAALRHFEECLSIYRRLRYTTNTVRTLDSMGDLHETAGHLREARDHWSEALKITKDAGLAELPEAVALSRKLKALEGKNVTPS